MQYRKTSIHAALIVLLALTIYWITLAPTVLWGDDGELQRWAVLGHTGGGVRTYQMWSSIAHGFTLLPFGDVAWRVNLVSAVFAALTIGTVFITIRVLDCSLLAAWAGSMALCISQTFWLHAIRTEVYSLFLFLLAMAYLLLLAWHRNTARVTLLFSGLLMSGFALHAHLLIVTSLPAIIFIIFGRRRTAVTYVVVIVAVVLVVLTSYWMTEQLAESHVSVTDQISAVLQIRARDVAMWFGFLGYQFVLLLPVGIWGPMKLWRTDRLLFIFLGLAFLGNVVWVMSFHVADQYVFYLPSYIVFAVWIGKGVDAIQSWNALRTRPIDARYLWSALVMTLLATVSFYRLVPAVLSWLGLNLMTARTLPNRDSNLFFLYPPKDGYYGARQFGEAIMDSLPPDAAVLMDHLPLQVLLYLQQVEGRRPDVLLVDSYVQPGQLAWLLQQSKTRPVFIADDESRYYDLAAISKEFVIRPFGPIFRLEKKTN